MIGASGAVGGNAVRTLATFENLERLTLLVRHPLAAPKRPAITQHTVDVLNPAAYQSFLPGHQVAICTLGIGNASKVSREEFIRVDKDAVLAFAAACQQAGIRHFELLSAVDANAKSSLFYLRTKGELENGLRALGFERLSLFRPSNILTPINRYGWTQAVILATWPSLHPLLRGRWRKYRGIRVETLGAAMARNLTTSGQGVETLHWDQFISLAEDAVVRSP